VSDPENEHLNRPADPAHETPGGFSPGSDDSSDPYDHAVPPGYDWPTHGGYLGCLLGLLASCAVAFVASTFVPPLVRDAGVPGWVAGLLTVVVFLAIVFAVARLGYILGKRFLREYPQPTRKTWGEDDDYVDSTLAEGEADSGERAESSSENEEEPQTEHVQET
jgi:hypothetical protein